jgi:hypothetical protein
MPSGPQPVRNLSRRPNGTGNPSQLVGDYHNPNLTPEAAALVKERGDRAKAGEAFPNDQEQCRPIAPPFTIAMQLSFQMLPARDGNLSIIHGYDNGIRRVRMNSEHPAKLAPSPMGDSVGQWDGDNLVIDTVGVRTDAFTLVDRLGTPQSERMHVIERYRLIDGALAKSTQDTHERIEGAVGNGNRASGVDPDTNLKGLQLELTMDDPKAFRAPLIVHVTYRRLMTSWQEEICANNPVEYYKGQWARLPKSDPPDF